MQADLGLDEVAAIRQADTLDVTLLVLTLLTAQLGLVILATDVDAALVELNDDWHADTTEITELGVDETGVVLEDEGAVITEDFVEVRP